MKIGDLVRVNCDNHFLNESVGVVVLNEHDESNPVPYGLCVIIADSVFGFLPEEVTVIDENR
jgi:hypothetical protein